MKKIPVVSAAVFTMVFCAVSFASPQKRIREIQSPLMAVPVFVEQGKSFKIELKLEGGEKLVAAFLQKMTNPLAQIELKTTPAAAEADGLLTLNAAVPAGTPAALYDLAVELTSERWDYQPHAVKVVTGFKSDFDFIQITDIHFNVQQEPGKDMNLIRRRIMSDVSALNPEFVIFTGDMGLDPETAEADYLYHWEQVTEYMRAPMFMVPGNHEQYYMKTDSGEEIDGAEYWAAAYGPKYHSFDYGKMHFIGMNDFDFERRWRDRRSNDTAFAGTLINGTIGPKQWAWAKADLADAKSRGQKCTAYMHIPVDMLMGGGRPVGMPPKQEKLNGPSPKQFADALNEAGCEYIFVGHMHYDKIVPHGALTEILSKASGIKGGEHSDKWGYRIIHVKDWKITGSEVHEIGFEDLK